MIKNKLYIINKRKKLLKKKTKKFALDFKFKKLKFYSFLYNYKVFIIIQYLINSNKDFKELKSFLLNLNNNIFFVEKKLLFKFNFKKLLTNNNVIVGLNNIFEIIKFTKKVKKRNDLFIIGFWVNNVLFSKYDLKINLSNKKNIYSLLINKIITFYRLIKTIYEILSLKIYNVLKYGNN